MKKFFASLFLAAALFVTSCGAAAPELLDFLGNDSETADYGGVKIVLNSEKNERNEKDTAWEKVLTYNSNTMYGEAVYSRIADIESSIGVDIELDVEADYETAKLKLMSGAYFADIINYDTIGAMQNYASAGLLYPITDFDIIDLSQTGKYGGANVLEGAMIKSVPYAVQPVSWPGWEPVDCTQLYYNIDIVKANNVTDPHEFWENENWYWDTFEENYLAAVELSSDVYVFSTTDTLYYYGLAYSNDLRYISVSDEGEYIVNPRPQSLLESLQKGVDWLKDYGEKMEVSSGFFEHDTYDEGNAMMTLAISNLANDPEIDIASGIMPFPCGPSAEYGVWCQALQRIRGFGIPISSAEPEVTAHVISLLFEPFDEYIGPIEDYYKDQVFNTEVDAEIYMALQQNARYDYTFDGGSDLMRSINNSLASAITSGRSAVETIDSYAVAIQSIIEKHLFPNYDYMYNNYYSLLED